MALKNYTSEIPVDRTLSNIQKMLSMYGANQVMIEYGNGIPVGIAFVITTPRGKLPIKLPARLDKVSRALYGREPRTEREQQQAHRTGWKNIYDWIDAQLALVKTEMVKLEEVFLPYMQDQEGVTFFERMEEKGFLLPSGT